MDKIIFPNYEDMKFIIECLKENDFIFALIGLTCIQNGAIDLMESE